MGCSNTKLPPGVIPENAAQLSNLLNMANSMETPQVVVEGEKFLNQASDVLMQASNALENAAEKIKNPFGDGSSNPAESLPGQNLESKSPTEETCNVEAVEDPQKEEIDENTDKNGEAHSSAKDDQESSVDIGQESAPECSSEPCNGEDGKDGTTEDEKTVEEDNVDQASDSNTQEQDQTEDAAEQADETETQGEQPIEEPAKDSEAAEEMDDKESSCEKDGDGSGE